MYKRRDFNLNGVNAIWLISDYLPGYAKNQRIPDDVKWQIIGEIERFKGFKCHVVVSSWFLFSGRQAADWQRLFKAEWYYKMPAADYAPADDYLDGLEIVRQSYIDLMPKYSGGGKTLLLLDPPYLSTSQAAYAQQHRFGLVDFLKLVNLTRPPFVFFSSTRSEFMDYVETIVDLKLDNWAAFEGVNRLSVNVSLSKQAKYEDNLVYKME